MDTHAVSSWSELERWATLPAWNERLPWDERLPESSDGFRFVFRGQSSATWPIFSSLARHLLAHSPPVKPDEWRRRELKMYRSFRERILRLCPRLYAVVSTKNYTTTERAYRIEKQRLLVGTCQVVTNPNLVPTQETHNDRS